MQKTLFKKYLRVTAAIILISFFLLGLVMLVFIKSYWQDEKQDLLRRNAESIAGIAAASATPVQGDNYILLDTERIDVYKRQHLCQRRPDAPRRAQRDEVWPLGNV